MFSRFPRTQSKIPSLIDYCVINRVLGRNREETSQYATVIIQSCSQECTLIANSPTFINILSALDRCNEWGLYYTGLVTFPHVVLLNQLNWFSIIFCLQSPDSQLFPEWLRNTSSQNWISPRFSSWNISLNLLKSIHFQQEKSTSVGKSQRKIFFWHSQVLDLIQ